MSNDLTKNEPCIVYIMSAGRSGSTLLGALLNNFPNSLYVGELYWWIKMGGIPNNERKDVHLFWEKIKKSVNIEEKQDLDFYSLFEYHSSFVRLPWLGRSLKKKKYKEFNSKILNSIAENSGKKYIIDSSHYPWRAYWLRKIGLNVKLIYLYRDPSSVVTSFAKKNIEHKYKNVFTANLYLFIVSTVSTLIFVSFKNNDKIKVIYEDIIEFPQNTITRLGNFLNIKIFEVDSDNLSTGPIFMANRIRHSSSIKLKTNNCDRTNSFSKLFTKSLQLPFILLNRRKN